MILAGNSSGTQLIDPKDAAIMSLNGPHPGQPIFNELYLIDAGKLKQRAGQSTQELNAAVAKLWRNSKPLQPLPHNLVLCKRQMLQV